MQDSSIESPVTQARIAGALYLIIFIAAPFAEIAVRGNLVVSGDAAATSANLLGHEALFRLGGVADLLAFACDVGIACLFYGLFRPVSRSLAAIASAFQIMHAAIAAGATLAHFAALRLLSDAQLAAAFSTAQVQALAMQSLRLHTRGYDIALLFFGIHCALTGYLILRSKLLPRALGVLIALAGACWLANSLAHLLAWSMDVSAFALPIAGVAELSLCLWLLFKGVNDTRTRPRHDTSSA